MNKYLHQYVAIKIHPLIDSFEGDKIVVRGKYERDRSIISYKEKENKLFNWKRPTVEISKDKSILYVNCFPGVDYVQHYGALIKTYFAINDIKNNVEIVTHLPNTIECNQQLIESNLVHIPPADIVIFGKVDHLLPFATWEGSGDFLWSQKTIGRKKVLFLGCLFSVWGDIAGSVTAFLAHKNIKAFLYTGKLGGLCKTMHPNETLATGDTSMLNNQLITWNNIITVPPHVYHVAQGKHITLFSPIAETKMWAHTVENNFSFVDPEIGHIAHESHVHKIGFGYIHIVSDNIVDMRKENLSNERTATIVKKRKQLIHDIWDIICYSIKKL